MTEPAIVMLALRQYGLDPAEVSPRQSGYRNRSYRASLKSGQQVNLIIYKSDADIIPRIRNANAVSNYLAAQGWPARHTVDLRILTLRSSYRTKYAALYNYLPGQTIPWEGYTQKHLKMLGATLGQMHTALMGLKVDQLPTVTDEYRAILLRVTKYFSQPSVARAATQKLGQALPGPILARYERLLAACARLPHQQPLHMDFVRSNVLFGDTPAGPEITGIIDFEKAAWGHPVFDVARTLAFLLVDSKYKTERQIRKYFLYSGYHKRAKQSVPDHRILAPLIDLFLIYDLYKFMRHNPYESLAQNEHYVRTRNLLSTRGIISPAQITAGLRQP